MTNQAACLSSSTAKGCMKISLMMHRWALLDSMQAA